MSDHETTIHQHLPNNITVNSSEFNKMLFIYNALQSGWEVKKKNDNYIFNKKHNNQKEIYLESYLSNFVHHNFDISSIIN